MSAMDLLLEHRSGEGRSRRLVRVGGGTDLFVIGSSTAADLRLSGQGVGGCHAALKRDGDGWVICDLSGANAFMGKGAGGDAIVERVLRADEPLSIQIGPHALIVVARSRDRKLFEETVGAPAQKTGENRGPLAHQVVVRDRRGKIVEVRSLGAAQSYVHRNGEESLTLVAPSSSGWTTTQVGARLIQQRLVPASEAALNEGLDLDRGLKRPLLMSIALFLLLGALGLVFGGKKTTEAMLDDKSKDMIFNAKTVKMKRAESRTMAQKRAAKQNAPANSAPASGAAEQEATAPRASNARAAHAIASLRASGLSALVGKIAARAAKQGAMVAAIGVSPETRGAGRAFFSHGSATVGGGGAAKEGPAFRLGGIATHGKGGGDAGAARAGTGLSGGKVGMGDVALVDEETVIEGGLDRDVIADVIKRNLGQIRYCYERQLSSNPDLYGKVMVRFVIGAGGDVGDQKIDQSTMKSALVEGCILRRVASWKFPLPKGGTTVKVSYPFLFKATE